MADIANMIDSSIKRIDSWYEKNQAPRNRLGLSQIGHDCNRFLWYKHKGYQELPQEGRVLRLFQFGHVIEEQMAIDLQSAGFTIESRQKQIEFTFNNETLTGSCDGIISGLVESSKPHLWECKSMNAKGFKKLLQNGYEKYNPQYKAQVHAYMLGLDLNRAFVTVLNKDTSALYQERIELKKEWIIDKLHSVFDTISEKNPPERLCPNADYFEAKWCAFYTTCF